jgi:NAD(P)-dependent dehydrogenase (short-subunit alcohol dehydrogenase family)
MSNKIVLITGAANGIGRSIADYFLQKGDTVIPTDIDEDNLKRFAGNEVAFPTTMDVTDFASVQSALKQIKNKFNYIDCIVNNAGVFVGGPIIEVDLKDFEKVFSINLMGYIRVVKAFYPLLRKGSRIINISSEVGRIAWPFNGPYTISKYAVEGFSDALRRELMFKDIKVIKIQPGSFNTNMMDCTKDSYKKYCEDSEFEEQINRVWDVLANEGCADPKFMAKIVYKSAHIKYPRYTYRVKNHKGRRMTEFLPSRVLDFIMKKWI